MFRLKIHTMIRATIRPNSGAIYTKLAPVSQRLFSEDFSCIDRQNDSDYINNSFFKYSKGVKKLEIDLEMDKESRNSGATPAIYIFYTNVRLRPTTHRDFFCALRAIRSK